MQLAETMGGDFPNRTGLVYSSMFESIEKNGLQLCFHLLCWTSVHLFQFIQDSLSLSFHSFACHWAGSVSVTDWRTNGRAAYLGVGQHHVLDEGQAARLSVLHAHVVHLVATDLAVLAPRQQGAPHDLERRGVEHLHLHAARRSPGNCG